MERRQFKIRDKSGRIALKLIPGHFATTHSHINCYIDITTLKIRQSEAMETARAMAKYYSTSTMIDTIVCMDGCEMIGAYLAEELSHNGIMSINSHNSLYVVSPEIDFNRQMIFRDNTQISINGKHVLILLASATTGKTIRRCIECVNYYGGHVAGVAAIFSYVPEVDGYKINALFDKGDLPDYQAHDPQNCPLCKANMKLDAIVNSYGYSKL